MPGVVMVRKRRVHPVARIQGQLPSGRGVILDATVQANDRKIPGGMVLKGGLVIAAELLPKPGKRRRK